MSKEPVRVLPKAGLRGGREEALSTPEIPPPWRACPTGIGRYWPFLNHGNIRAHLATFAPVTEALE